MLSALAVDVSTCIKEYLDNFEVASIRRGLKGVAGKFGLSI